MKLLCALLSVLALCAACTNDVRATPDADELGATDPKTADVRSGRVTLRLDDPFQDTYDFDRAAYGAVIQGGEVKNAGSHLGYLVNGTHERGELQVGIQGGESGAIIDLGTDDEVAARTGVQQTGRGGNGFASLSLDGAVFNDSQASAVFAGAAPSRAAALDHHVYVLRIVRPPAADLVIKLFVVSIVEGREVSCEWIRVGPEGS